MTNENEENRNQLIVVSDWDSPLPIGDWSGPRPISPFMPRFGEHDNPSENAEAFRDTIIRSAVSRDAATELKHWVQDNVPEKFAWLVRGLESWHPMLPVDFLALNSAEIRPDEDTFISDHPEVVDASWDSDLDAIRLRFVEKLKELECSVSLMTHMEALDGGVFFKKGYERPRAMQLPDIAAMQTDKRLWHYFTLSKFTRFI